MMKRQEQNRNNRGSNRRNLRIESLEDRRLLTVAAELAPMPQQMQRGSDHLPSVAEIAVEKATDRRLSMHNKGPFGGCRTTAADGIIILTEDPNQAVEKLQQPGADKAWPDDGKMPWLKGERPILKGTSVGNPGTAGLNEVSEDLASEAADGNSEAATDSIPGGYDAALDSVMAEKHDPTDCEDEDDEGPGLPDEDDVLNPKTRDFLRDPAATLGADRNEGWDALKWEKS